MKKNPKAFARRAQRSV